MNVGIKIRVLTIILLRCFLHDVAFRRIINECQQLSLIKHLL